LIGRTTAGDRYYRLGQYTKAEPFYLRALAIQEQSLGASAPELATTLADYAALLKQTGRSRQAWDVERRAEEIRRVNP
jgi:tetratricopeptide (TPR) repeat protein